MVGTPFCLPLLDIIRSRRSINRFEDDHGFDEFEGGTNTYKMAIVTNVMTDKRNRFVSRTKCKYVGHLRSYDGDGFEQLQRTRVSWTMPQRYVDIQRSSPN